jgi:hypothetical protein
MDIRRKFLKLTKRTYPYGTETQLVSHLPHGYFKDAHGNYYYEIGKSKTAFTCHLDTACKTQVVVNHKIDKNIISTDGKSILGADDKAGMTILLYMIEKRIPGLYCFFIGEEVGCIGSGKASDDSYFLNYDRMISFDRRGTKSVITFQSSKRCCSDDFAQNLSSQLNRYGLSMEPDDTGVYTDSAEFTHVIPECTNISVGYYKEHTNAEHQDIEHLIKLCVAVTKVDWESLPTKRDPKQVEYKSYSYRSYGYSTYDKDYKQVYDSRNSCDSGWGRYSGWDKSPSGAGKKSRRSAKRASYGYYDDFYFEDSDHTTPVTSKYDNMDRTGRAFLDDLDNDFTDEYYGNYQYKETDKFHYESLKQSLYNDSFTKEEKQAIKDQYLDVSDYYDSEFVDDFMRDDFPI